MKIDLLRCSSVELKGVLPSHQTVETLYLAPR